MRHSFYTLFLFIAILLFAASAHAEITVTITSVAPTDGTIGEDETATIYWKIEAGTTSGEYDVVVGGDGTPGTGEAVADSNGSGTFTGTVTGQTDILPSDLEGDGDYTIYVIAVDDADEANYGAASTTITLDTPPGAVTGFSVSDGDSRVFLSWTEHSDSDIDYYLVYYGTHSGSVAADYDGMDSSDGTSPVNVDNVTEFILTGLVNGTTYYLRISAVDDAGTESPLSEQVSATPTKAMGAAGLSNDKEGCFIATAAYGSYDEAHVKSLRAFRDRVLLKTDLGRRFVDTYYRLSPPIAAVVAESPTLRLVVRAALWPAAFISDAVLSPMKSMLTAALTLVSAAFGFVLIRRNARRKDS